MVIDLKRERPDLYRPRTREVVEVLVPHQTALAVDGHGDPNTSPAYRDSVAALYTAAYAVRVAFLTRTGERFVVGPLEGLWSSADPGSFTARRKGEWDWTMLVVLPDPVAAELGDAGLDQALDTAARRKPDLPVDHVSRVDLHEGRCLQVLHVGRYDDEGPTLARLHDEVMPRLGLTWNGPHHEIYLGDPRRTAPERLRTVLRQPVRPVTDDRGGPAPT